jgi:hypothetical protein
MVPTLCIQNYCHTNMTKSWCPTNETNVVAGSVSHELVLLHLQLLGIQEDFTHYVSSILSLLIIMTVVEGCVLLRNEVSKLGLLFANKNAGGLQQ